MNVKVNTPKYSIGQLFLAPMGGEVRVDSVTVEVDNRLFPAHTHVVYGLTVTRGPVIENRYFSATLGESYNRGEDTLDFNANSSNGYLPMIREYFEIEGYTVQVDSVGWNANGIPNSFQAYLNGEKISAWTNDHCFDSVNHAVSVVADRIRGFQRT